jgi:hypothetical protein
MPKSPRYLNLHIKITHTQNKVDDERKSTQKKRLTDSNYFDGLRSGAKRIHQRKRKQYPSLGCGRLLHNITPSTIISGKREYRESRHSGTPILQLFHAQTSSFLRFTHHGHQLAMRETQHKEKAWQPKSPPTRTQPIPDCYTT